MVATIRPQQDEDRRQQDEHLDLDPTASNRAGYAFAMVVNGGLLYVVHHLLGWGWPDFLTEDFEQLLPLLTFSFIASIVVNAVFFVSSDVVTKSIGDFLTSSIAFVVGIRTLQIFPFDFSEYATDWSTLVRVVIVVSLIGIVIAIVATFVRLAWGLLLR